VAITMMRTEHSRNDNQICSGSSGARQSVHVTLTWDNPLLTLRQASQYAICTPRYLQNQIRAGRLKALKPTSKFLRIRRVELDRFLESGATIGGEA